MKKAVVLGLVAIAVGGAAVAIALKREKDKIKQQLEEKNPEELIKILNDATTVLELKQIADMDEPLREKFEKAKHKLRETTEKA